MKKTIAFFLLILPFCKVFSQNEHLIFKFYGLSEYYVLDELLKGYNVPDEEMENMRQYYLEHKNEFLSAFDENRISIQMARVNKIRTENAGKIEAMKQNLNAAIASAVQRSQQEKMRKEAEAKARDIEFQQLISHKVDNRPNSAPVYVGSASTTSTSKENYKDLYTADQDMNRQIDLWVQQYGVAETRKLVAKRNGFSLPVETQFSGQNNSGGATQIQALALIGGQMKPIMIKVNGGRVVAYRYEFNKRWEWAVVDEPILNTDFNKDGNLSYEYNCVAVIRYDKSSFTNFYFNM